MILSSFLAIVVSKYFTLSRIIFTVAIINESALSAYFLVAASWGLTGSNRLIMFLLTALLLLTKTCPNVGISPLDTFCHEGKFQ